LAPFNWSVFVVILAPAKMDGKRTFPANPAPFYYIRCLADSGASRSACHDGAESACHDGAESACLDPVDEGGVSASRKAKSLPLTALAT
jgi:hypothetical protein